MRFKTLFKIALMLIIYPLKNMYEIFIKEHPISDQSWIDTPLSDKMIVMTKIRNGEKDFIVNGCHYLIDS